VDIALKYGYETQANFSRAFKEMHGRTPLSARRNGTSFKTFPKITFRFMIKGVNEMNFRIRKQKTASEILGFSSQTGTAATGTRL
jgi:AraC family transcriptional regulator